MPSNILAESNPDNTKKSPSKSNTTATVSDRPQDQTRSVTGDKIKQAIVHNVCCLNLNKSKGQSASSVVEEVVNNTNNDTQDKENTSAATDRDLLRMDSMDIVPDPDNKNARNKLRLVMQIADRCLEEKTAVKALSGGTKLIVLTYCYQELSSDTKGEGGVQGDSMSRKERKLHQYIERLTLPCVIDAFSVLARIGEDRRLIIEAPVIKNTSADD